MEKRIRFHGVESVRSFLAITSGFPEKLEIHEKDMVIDAKSLMGLFSLDLDKPLKLTIDADKGRCTEICYALSPFFMD